MTNIFSDLSPAYLLAVLAVVFAHASFQLGISVLTLLSSHTIGAARAHKVLLRLDSSYILGVLLTSLGVLLAVRQLISYIPANSVDAAWLVLSIVSVVVGLFIIRFYYRRSKGTALWVPRAFAQYLTRRTKRTKSSIEAFGLGILTVIAELPFTITAFAIFAFILTTSPAPQMSWMVAYVILISFPLLVLGTLISGGHKLSDIQKWREANKKFLQFSSGITLILLGAYLAILHFGSNW